MSATSTTPEVPTTSGASESHGGGGDTHSGGTTGAGERTCGSFYMGEDCCQTYVQECGPGAKCNLSTDTAEASEWNAHRCVPLSPRLRQQDERCRILDHPLSGRDDCDVGLVCHPGAESDPREDLVGRCLPLCFSVDPFWLACPTVEESCLTEPDGVSICYRRCDPTTAGPCPVDGDTCRYTDLEFACQPGPPPDERVPVGGTCSNAFECSTGMCVGREFLPDCATDYCCASPCDLRGSDPCPGTIPVQVCHSWWTTVVGVRVEPDYEHVGFCAPASSPPP